MNHSELSAYVDKVVAQLGEHLDAVQVLVSLPLEGGGTGCIKRGCGNWYARQGLAQEFIARTVAEENADQIALRLKPKGE